MQANYAAPLSDYKPGFFDAFRPQILFTPRREERPEQESIFPGDKTAEAKSRPRALIVDDAPDVTEMLSMFLQHAGYETVMAFSAAEALEKARGGSFEVIVSDIGMPGMNGYDLAAALRSLPGYRKVPMIAVTGFSIYDDRGRAMASGFNAHMTKPINPAALLDLIKALETE